MLSKTQVKYIQSLTHKKFREEENAFIAEGPKLVKELLGEKLSSVRHIYALPEWMDENKTLLKSLQEEQLIVINQADLERISLMHTPNQVLAVVQQFGQASPVDCKNQLVLALDNIQDPGNMGTIIRIADWFGISHIICSEECADRYNPKVVQSTMGSIMRVNLSYENLSNFLAQQKDCNVFAAALEGTPVHQISKGQKGILLIGNESKGISDALMKVSNKKITIPKIGTAESLNAAVATGIILSHLLLR